MQSFDVQLKGKQTVAIAGHVRPDGDCVGSCLATYNYITTYYPQIKVDLYLEPIPNIFKFLNNSDKIRHSYEGETVYDLCIAQDCGDLGRLGFAADCFTNAKQTFCVDHHISNQNFADENYIFPQASSASELVYELIEEEKITKEIAECIYVGIIHDTGVFQYSCTSAKTMNIAGNLMQKGIDFTKIIEDTFYTKTYNQNRILGQALVGARLAADGKVVYSVITKEQMAEYEVLPKHLDGIVSQLRVTKDVQAAIFLYETDDGYKVSMRSGNEVNVAEVAMKFGGGGHIKAAGVSMEGTPDTILKALLDEIQKQL